MIPSVEYTRKIDEIFEKNKLILLQLISSNQKNHNK